MESLWPQRGSLWTQRGVIVAAVDAIVAAAMGIVAAVGVSVAADRSMWSGDHYDRNWAHYAAVLHRAALCCTAPASAVLHRPALCETAQHTMAAVGVIVAAAGTIMAAVGCQCTGNRGHYGSWGQWLS